MSDVSKQVRHWTWALALSLAAAGGWSALSPARTSAAGDAVEIDDANVRTAEAARRPLRRTLRVSGVTEAERYAGLRPPRMMGSRSDRGRTARTNLVQANSTITVSTTSTVGSGSSMSSLSQTGVVTSTSNAGGAGVGSAAMTAATTRVGGQARSSGGNVAQVAATTSAALGESGLGSTAESDAEEPAAAAGGGMGMGMGGGRRDFQLSLIELAPGGTYVKKGDVVAVFDTVNMQTRCDDYEASVQQIEASFVKGKSDLFVELASHEQALHAAKGRVEQARLDLKAVPVLSAIRAEQLRLALQEAEADYEALLRESPLLKASQRAETEDAAIDVKQANLELERAQRNLDRLYIKAPMDGILVYLNVVVSSEIRQVKEGDDLRPGMPFVQIVDPSSMLISAAVNQVDLEDIRVGQKADVRFDAFPGLTLPAHVYSIGTLAKARQYRQEYLTEIPVVLKLDALDKRVIPDLTVSADIVLREEPDAVVIPRHAVHGDASDFHAFVRTGAGWEKRPIEVGLGNHINVQVLNGLKEGETVALAPAGLPVAAARGTP